MKNLFDKEEFENINEAIIANSMFKSFILSYAKCFSNSGQGRISLDANHIFNSKPLLKAIHERMMEIRNKYVAHNDNYSCDFAINVVSQDSTKIILANTYTTSTPVNEFQDFLKALKHCEGEVIKKLNKKLDKIVSRLGKKIVLT